MAVKFPLQYLIPIQLEDEKGRPLSQVGGIENDFEGQLVMYISQNLNLQSLPLNFIIKALVENQVFSTANIMKMVGDSPIIVEDRYFVIEETLTSFFKENYLVFCHLIVPQIESFFRELLDKSGKSVIKPQNNSKSQGYTLRILDDILRDEVISSTFNENMKPRKLDKKLSGFIMSDRKQKKHGYAERLKYVRLIEDGMSYQYGYSNTERAAWQLCIV